jgi:hypothetical protein
MTPHLKSSKLHTTVVVIAKTTLDIPVIFHTNKLINYITCENDVTLVTLENIFYTLTVKNVFA